MKYHTLIETCKNVGLNVKEYFTYVFSRLIEGEKDYEKLSPVLLHSKFKQTKVKTKITNGSPAPFIRGWKQLSAYFA